MECKDEEQIHGNVKTVSCLAFSTAVPQSGILPKEKGSCLGHL
jgi:hypothetical protein